MNEIGGVIMLLTVYGGAAAIGLLLFGEGTGAMLFGGVLGTFVLGWIIKNQEKK
jgi:hypothetical protein